MTQVVSIRAGRTKSNRFLKDIRKEFGLSQAQAAFALNVSTGTIENWDQFPNLAPDAEFIFYKFQLYKKAENPTAGQNLLFGVFPVSFARAVLRESVKTIASRYGYSVSNWQKIEANGRSLSAKTIETIEGDVRECISVTCLSAND